MTPHRQLKTGVTGDGHVTSALRPVVHVVRLIGVGADLLLNDP